MKFDIISEYNKKKYRHNFLQWMKSEYPNIKRPDIMHSNVMLSIKNNIGFSINDLILGKISLSEYGLKYTEYFTSINRKSPRVHAQVQVGNAKYYLEFINHLYELD